MNLSGFSFFEHEDFKFAKSEAEELSMKTVERNLVKIDIWNDNMYLGGSVRGIVRILIPKNLKPGQVILKLETSITSKVRSKVNPVSSKTIIQNYKQCVEPIKEPRPLRREFKSSFNLRGITGMMKAKINKVQNIGSIQKLKRLMRRGRVNQNQNMLDMMKAQKKSGSETNRSLVPAGIGRINRDQLRKEVEKAKHLERVKKIKKRKSKNSRKKSARSKSSRKLRKSSSFEKVKTGEGDEGRYMPEMEKIYSETTAVLFSKDMKLFTLREHINERRVLIIPFEVKIPIGFPTSCEKDIDLQNQISLIFKRNQALNPNLTLKKDLARSPRKKKTCLYSGEFIKLNHKLVAFFVTLDDIREYNRMENLSESKTLNLHRPFFNSARMSSQMTFKVYQKMNQNDFLKCSSVAQIKVKNEEEGESKCCSFFRNLKQKIFKNIDLNIEISIDRTVFRTSDNTINLVVKFKNKIMRKYDYIDLVLISRTTITDFEELKSKNRSNLDGGDSVFMNLENQQFRAFKDRDFYQKPVISINKPTIQVSGLQNDDTWKIGPRRFKSNNEKKFEKMDSLEMNYMPKQTPFSSKRSIKSNSRNANPSAGDKNNSNFLGVMNPGVYKISKFIKRSISKPSDKSNVLIQQALKNARKERVKIAKKENQNNSETKAKIETIQMIKSLKKKNTSSTNGTSGTDLSNKGTAVDQILYATSLDLMGKRDITDDMIVDSTELVHRIQLDQIKCDLQTVKTDFITVSYHLQFYLSVGPLGFRKKIRKVDLYFINTPDTIVIDKTIMSKRLVTLNRIQNEMDNVMMLPYSKVNPEDEGFQF